MCGNNHFTARIGCIWAFWQTWRKLQINTSFVPNSVSKMKVKINRKRSLLESRYPQGWMTEAGFIHLAGALCNLCYITSGDVRLYWLPVLWCERSCAATVYLCRLHEQHPDICIETTEGNRRSLCSFTSLLKVKNFWLITKDSQIRTVIVRVDALKWQENYDIDKMCCWKLQKALSALLRGNVLCDDTVHRKYRKYSRVGQIPDFTDVFMSEVCQILGCRYAASKHSPKTTL